jgi:hypothetical protein
MTTPLNEAFALVLLENNYFAWLCDAKQSFPSLITDYDDEDLIEEANGTMVEYLMLERYVDLKHGNMDKSFVVLQPENENETEAEQETTDYKNAKMWYRKRVRDVRDKVKLSMKYQQVLDSNKDLGEDKEGDQVYRKKKRKILKELKNYTGSKVDSERAFRGWSMRGYKMMMEYKTAIDQDKLLYQQFDRAYRHIVAIREKETESVTQTVVSSTDDDDSDLDGMIDFEGV